MEGVWNELKPWRDIYRVVGDKILKNRIFWIPNDKNG
jgi:hypothetical protein